MHDFEDLAGEYAGSQQFLLRGSPVNAQAAGELLGSFAEGCRLKGIAPETFTIAGLEEVLFNHLAGIDAALAVRREIPGLLCGFFDYLVQSGRFPAAAPWTRWVRSLEKRYLTRFREDGSVRGETFRKRYTDVNRNDPCPCGSGKKFKKCCMNIIS